MIETGSIPEFQESFEIAYDYIYCDRCGSFNIGVGSKIPGSIEKILVFIVVIAIPAAIIGAAASWMVSLSFLLAGLITFIILATTSTIKCEKCGNRHFTNGNVLRYSENDRSVIDVPDLAIHKQKVK